MPREGFQTVPATTEDQEGEVKRVEELNATLPPFMEVGDTGLKRAAGYLDEEFLPQLRGRKAVQVYKEMSSNDPLVGALLHAINMLLRNVEWTVKPGGKSKTDADAAHLVETAMEDMSQTWDDFITEVLTMLVYGWSYHEIVYKRRGGLWQDNSRLRSKHTDGLIGWRKMPIRAQETLVRWIFDDKGDVRAMLQMPPPKYSQITLPIDRCLLFRFKHHKGNPEGVSMLRNAYRPWFMKKRLEEFEAVGIERDLAGLPLVKVPAEYLMAAPNTKQAKVVKDMKKMIKTIRRNEQEGLVFPVQYDQDTKQPLYSIELLGSGGGRQFQTDPIIQRYEQRILMSVLADFIMVGHQGTGSYSMHIDKTGLFRTSLNAIAQSIADVLNRHAIPRLMRVNGWRLEELPQIVANDVDAPDIGQLAQFMGSMASLGMQWFPDAELEKFVREAARLPSMDEDEKEQERKLEEMSDATRFAQKQAEFIQTKQQLSQMMMGQMQPQQPGQQAGQQPQQPQQGGQQQ